MTLSELLDEAKKKQGTLGRVAELLGIQQSAISHWRKGTYKPDTTNIVKLAELAGLPVLETVAQIESQLHPEVSEAWQRALGKLRAAGVAASVTSTTLVTATLLASLPSEANAITRHSDGVSVYYVKRRRDLAKRVFAFIHRTLRGLTPAKPAIAL